jgi:uncharacterized membrane protein
LTTESVGDKLANGVETKSQLYLESFMSGHSVVRFVIILAAFAALAAPASATDDQRTRTISGTVFDAMGGVIGGASVT